MLRTFRYPLHPTAAQEAVLIGWLGVCCDIYNADLRHRRDAWEHEKRQRQLAEDRGEKRERVKMPSYQSQTAELALARQADASLEAVPSNILRSPLRRCQRAFDGFFRRCKAGETPGYPRFRARDRYDSFEIGRVSPHNDESRGTRSARVRVPKLGLVRFHEYRSLKGTVLSTTVRRCAGKWFICFACDVGAAPAKVAVRNATAIDLGLTSFATLSDGTSIENPRYFRHAEGQLAVRQQRLARRKRDSKGRRRAKLLVGKAHAHVRQQRLDFARKLACLLYASYDLVAYEDLNIRGMVRGSFAKSINDASWGLFIHALNCKAASAGRWAVPVNPRGTTIDCSGCGERVPKDLSVRVHACPQCGLTICRDVNAARNVLALGRSAVSQLAQAS